MSYIGGYNPGLLRGVKHLHFIGIGGSGMYPLVQILNSRGYEISGSDVNEGSIIDAERALGITMSAPTTFCGSWPMYTVMPTTRRTWSGRTW